MLEIPTFPSFFLLRYSSIVQ